MSVKAEIQTSAVGIIETEASRQSPDEGLPPLAARRSEDITTSLPATLSVIRRFSAFVLRHSPLIILLLALALRLNTLTDQNIWWDEGWSVWMGRLDFGEIARITAADEHPPLHYWWLRVWDGVVGETAFAVRYASVLWGVAGVVLIYALGRRIGGRSVGLVAATFLTLSRFHIWWSQDIKMYTMTMAFSLASLYLVHRWVTNDTSNDTSNRRPAIGNWQCLWPAYVIVTAVALFSHYLAGLVILSENLLVLLVLIARWRVSRSSFLSLLWQWSTAQLTLIALFLPWLAMMVRSTITWKAAPAFDFALFLRLYFTVLSLGITTFIERYTLLVVLFVIVALGGLALLRPGRRDDGGRPLWIGGALTWIVLILPPGLIYLLSLPQETQLYAAKLEARYLLIVLPGFALTLAGGWVAWRRWFGRVTLLPLLVLFILQGWSLHQYYAGRHLYDDYQSLVGYLHTYAEPDDAVLLHTDQNWPVFAYYEGGTLPRYDVPLGRPVTPASAEEIVNRVVSRHDTVWLVVIPDALAKDPGRLIEKVLARRLPRLADERFGNKRLLLFSRGERLLAGRPGNHLNIPSRLDCPLPPMRLVGYDLPVRRLRPGDLLQMGLFWRVDSDEPPQTLELGLQDAAGRVVRRERQPFWELSAGRSGWPEGIVRSHLRLPISSGIHAGDYQVVLRPMRGDVDWTPVTRVMILPGYIDRDDHRPSGLTHPRSDNFGGLVRLIGFDVRPHPPDLAPIDKERARLRPGGTLRLTLYWEAQETMAESYTVFVHYLGQTENPVKGNRLWGQEDSIPVRGSYPTTAWTPGEIVADSYEVTLQADAPAGLYEVEIGLYNALDGKRLPVLGPDGQILDDRVVLLTVTAEPVAGD